MANIVEAFKNVSEKVAESKAVAFSTAVSGSVFVVKSEGQVEIAGAALLAWTVMSPYIPYRLRRSREIISRKKS